MIASSLARSRAFDGVLIAHVVVAACALVVLVVLRASAAAVERGGPLPESAQRTFAQRREVAGRVVHLVPLTGLWLLALSHGDYSLATPFVLAGIALWVLAATALEAVGFPARRGVSVALAGGADASVPARRLRVTTELAGLALVAAALAMVVGSL